MARRRSEVAPSRRLLAADSVRAILLAAIAGCALLVALDLAAMIITGVAFTDGGSRVDLLGLGIIGSAFVGIAVLALAAGYATTVSRLALASFYSGFAPRSRELRDTIEVRGQASPSPYAPAQAATVVLGSAALLGAFVCGSLAFEHLGFLDDGPHHAQFVMWASWFAVMIAVVLLCTATAFWFARLNRKWAKKAGTLLPEGAVGHRLPAVRTTTRAERRAARRSWSLPQWADWFGRLSTLVGAGVLFLGVYLHKPGRLADTITYDAAVERVIGVLMVGGGVLLGAGFVVLCAVGADALHRTIVVMRRAAADSRGISKRERGIVGSSTTLITNALDYAITWWTAFAILMLGVLFTREILLPAEGDSADPSSALLDFDLTITAVLWLSLGLLIVGARVAINAIGPTIRNRFGYTIPSEVDNSEYPDLNLHGH